MPGSETHTKGQGRERLEHGMSGCPALKQRVEGLGWGSRHGEDAALLHFHSGRALVASGPRRQHPRLSLRNLQSPVGKCLVSQSQSAGGEEGAPTPDTAPKEFLLQSRRGLPILSYTPGCAAAAPARSQENK